MKAEPQQRKFYEIKRDAGERKTTNRVYTQPTERKGERRMDSATKM